MCGSLVFNQTLCSHHVLNYFVFFPHGWKLKGHLKPFWDPNTSFTSSRGDMTGENTICSFIGKF